jgi:TfoX/Sxy family transcriptional regulator of competence genes
MAYNLKLAERIRAELQGLPVVEKKMFGGVGYILNSNMACGILGEDMIVRVSVDEYETLLKRANVKIFTMKGGPKPMKGWLMVEPEGCKTQKQLSAWVKKGVEFTLTLPPK